MSGLAKATWASVGLVLALDMAAVFAFGGEKPAYFNFEYLPVILLFVDLCALWLWSNWIMYHACIKLIHRVQGRQSIFAIETAVLKLFQVMRQTSSLWAVNHTVRLVTTTVAATAFLARAQYQAKVGTGSGLQQQTFVLCATGATLYMLVWITAAVPGYVTDKLFNGLLQQLSKGAHQVQQGSNVTYLESQEHQEGAEEEEDVNVHDGIREEKEITRLMQRISR
jgi:hypothetical protein